MKARPCGDADQTTSLNTIFVCVCVCGDNGNTMQLRKLQTASHAFLPSFTVQFSTLCGAYTVRIGQMSSTLVSKHIAKLFFCCCCCCFSRDFRDCLVLHAPPQHAQIVRGSQITKWLRRKKKRAKSLEKLSVRQIQTSTSCWCPGALFSGSLHLPDSTHSVVHFPNQAQSVQNDTQRLSLHIVYTMLIFADQQVSDLRDFNSLW